MKTFAALRKHSLIAYLGSMSVLFALLFKGIGFVLTLFTIAILIAAYEIKKLLENEQMQAKELSDFLEFTGLMEIRLRKLNSTVSNALTASAGAIQPGTRMHAMINEIGARLKYQDFGQSILSAMQSKPKGQISSQSMEMLKELGSACVSGKDSLSGISEYNSLAREALESKANFIIPKLGKYATLQMLSSTILPSFALFGLAGYSILSQSDYSVPILLFAMAVAFPCIYYIVDLKMKVMASYVL